MRVEVSDQSLAAAREATTLDRVHAAMLLQASGRTNALRALLKAEQERGSDFLRLANALSALYPKGKRGEAAARRDVARGAAMSALGTSATPRAVCQCFGRASISVISRYFD